MKDKKLWLCHKKLVMDAGEVVFKKNKVYEEVKHTSSGYLELYNEQGDEHVVAASSKDLEWLQYFTQVVPVVDKIEPKEILFTTEDGVKIYEGDKYWYVIANFIHPNSYTLLRHTANWGNPNKSPLGKVQFADISTGEKWLDENKPIFSKKQIKDALKNSHPILGITKTDFDISIFIKELNLD
jgi:hypothetical protein